MSRRYTCVATADHTTDVSSVVRMADFSRPYPRLPQDDRNWAGGVLLLFTGVRYERQIEPAEPVAEGGRTRRRRRR